MSLHRNQKLEKYKYIEGRLRYISYIIERDQSARSVAG